MTTYHIKSPTARNIAQWGLAGCTLITVSFLPALLYLYGTVPRPVAPHDTHTILPSLNRCNVTEGAWCEEWVLARLPDGELNEGPFNGLHCPGQCSGVGVCQADIGYCDCPAGQCGPDSVTFSDPYSPGSMTVGDANASPAALSPWNPCREVSCQQNLSSDCANLPSM